MCLSVVQLTARHIYVHSEFGHAHNSTGMHDYFDFTKFGQVEFLQQFAHKQVEQLYNFVTRSNQKLCTNGLLSITCEDLS